MVKNVKLLFAMIGLQMILNGCLLEDDGGQTPEGPGAPAASTNELQPQPAVDERDVYFGLPDEISTVYTITL